MQQQSRKQRAQLLLSYVGLNMFIGLLVVGGISAIYWATKFSQNHKDCWETSVGQELYKLSIFDFFLMLAFAFLVTLPRRLLVDHFSGQFWVWLGREEFLVPKNVLDIVAGQTVTWMGLFYCPLLPLLSSIFSSSSLFMSKSIPASGNCGLFSNYSAPWQVVPEAVAIRLSPAAQKVFYYLSSNVIWYPILILLSLTLTVCISQSSANKKAIKGLRRQLLWQVREKWHLVEDLSQLLQDSRGPDSWGPRSPNSQSSHPRSFCPGFPCPGSPKPRLFTAESTHSQESQAVLTPYGEEAT